MPPEIQPLVVLLIIGNFLMVTTLALAKGRNPWAWAALGLGLPLLSLAIIPFLPALCPRCRSRLTDSERKDGRCFSCRTRFGWFKRRKKSKSSR